MFWLIDTCISRLWLFMALLTNVSVLELAFCADSLSVNFLLDWKGALDTKTKRTFVKSWLHCVRFSTWNAFSVVRGSFSPVKDWKIIRALHIRIILPNFDLLWHVNYIWSVKIVIKGGGGGINVIWGTNFSKILCAVNFDSHRIEQV